MRLITATLLFIISGSIAAASADNTPNVVTTDTVTYRIERKGKKIGRHQVVRTQQDNGLIRVDISFSIRVKFAFITAFKMDHEAQELWSAEGKLLDLKAKTDRKSGQFDVRLSPQDEDGFELRVNGETDDAPPSVMPTSFTFPQSLFIGETRPVLLLDTLSGFLKPSTIHALEPRALQFEGRETVTDYYEITYDETGDVTHRIWVGDDLAFLKLGLFTKDGHYIEYFREPS